MSASPSKRSETRAEEDEYDSNWVSPKRRPAPPPIATNWHRVSRQSGMREDSGTFGKALRFQTKIGRGAHSPNGEKFYHRNQMYKGKYEQVKSCSQGVGERPRLMAGGPSQVAPGSYEIIASCAYPRSPLDGPEYCNMSMHGKLPSMLTAKNMVSPGPHHRYEVNKPLGHQLPDFAVPRMARGGRTDYPEDRDGPGPGGYYDPHGPGTLAHSTSTPNMKAGSGASALGLEATGGTKRCLKTTFGTADRFGSVKLTSSPKGDLYYAHAKFMTAEDYLSGGKSCSFGVSAKTDFSNPMRAHKSDVGPVHYEPQKGYSLTGKTSPLDGINLRCESPVYASRSTKNASRFGRSRSSSMVGSPGATQGSPGAGASNSGAQAGTASSPSAEVAAATA